MRGGRSHAANKTTHWTADALDATSQSLAGKGPVQMVNLLRYRTQADYGAPSDLAPCSGREAYQTRYVPAFSKVPGAEKAVISWIGNVQATVVAPEGEAWDDIAIVEYPSFEALRSIIDHPQYQTEAAPHQSAALADWRFIATTKFNLPG